MPFWSHNTWFSSRLIIRIYVNNIMHCWFPVNWVFAYFINLSPNKKKKCLWNKCCTTHLFICCKYAQEWIGGKINWTQYDAYVFLLSILEGSFCFWGAAHSQSPWKPGPMSAHLYICLNCAYQSSQHDTIHLGCSVPRCLIMSKSENSILWLTWCEA